MVSSLICYSEWFFKVLNLSVSLTCRGKLNSTVILILFMREKESIISPAVISTIAVMSKPRKVVASKLYNLSWMPRPTYGPDSTKSSLAHTQIVNKKN